MTLALYTCVVSVVKKCALLVNGSGRFGRFGKKIIQKKIIIHNEKNKTSTHNQQVKHV